MLNNKKNLLQRVRIAMVAIVAILGIGGAFAMTPPEHKAAQTYGVLSTGTNFYHVTASSNADCDLAPTRVCKIVSAVAPDSNGNINSSDVISSEAGAYPQ